MRVVSRRRFVPAKTVLAKAVLARAGLVRIVLARTVLIGGLALAGLLAAGGAGAQSTNTATDTATATAAATATEPRTYTLDDVLSRPVLSNLTAASAAARVAWVENRRGVRNLWTAAASDYTPLRLTDFDADDGQALSSLQLTEDGSLLVYVRGSGPNAAGEVANPASDPAGVEQSLWAVPTDGGRSPWKLTGGGGGVLTQGGRSLLVARGSQVFEVGLEPPSEDVDGDDKDGSGGKAEPNMLFSARGTISDLTLSPTGRRIAFVSNRGDHSFIGVYDRGAKSIVWIDPSVDRDSHPTFSGDGEWVGFIRTPGAEIGERFDITSGTSFSVRIGRPDTGASNFVWQFPEGAGGFAQFYPPTALAFASTTGYLVLTSEHSGYLHIHRLATWDSNDPDGLPADDGAVDLTPGDFEVEGFRLGRHGTTLYAWGNHGDLNRRHIRKIDIQTGRSTQVTRGPSIEADPVPLADGGIAFRQADHARPMAIVVADGDGRDPRIVAPAAWPERFPMDALVTPEAVTFDAADGTTIHGQLFRPSAGDPGSPRPAVIYLHGGPIRQMLLGWHYSDYYANAYAFNQFLASRGYVVLAVNFRAGIGYGRDFRRAPNQGPRGASEYQDVVAAGHYLAGRDDVDGSRIGLWGGSYGGLLTAMGLARDSDLFAAGVDLHGVHNWSFRATDLPLPGGAWGLGDDDLAVALRSSPVADIDTWRSPVLFVHGDDDRNVLFQQTTDLVQKLRARDVHIETLVFPDEVHGFLRYESWKRTFEAAFDFFERFLAAPTEAEAAQ